MGRKDKMKYVKVPESDIENQLSIQNTRILWLRGYALICIVIFTVIMMVYYSHLHTQSDATRRKN